MEDPIQLLRKCHLCLRRGMSRSRETGFFWMCSTCDKPEPSRSMWEEFDRTERDQGAN